MKKILLASLLIISAISTDVMAGDKKGKKEHKKPEFENGCMVTTELKGPMADMIKNADSNSDGCITEEEFKTHMKNHKPEGKPEGMPFGKKPKKNADKE